jgi:hypothetical protein
MVPEPTDQLHLLAFNYAVMAARSSLRHQTNRREDSIHCTGRGTTNNTCPRPRRLSRNRQVTAASPAASGAWRSDLVPRKRGRFPYKFGLAVCDGPHVQNHADASAAVSPPIPAALQAGPGGHHFPPSGLVVDYRAACQGIFTGQVADRPSRDVRPGRGQHYARQKYVCRRCRRIGRVR